MAANKRSPAELYDLLYQVDKKKTAAKSIDELPIMDTSKKQVKPLWKNTFNGGEKK